MFTGSLNRDVLRVIAEYARVSKATDVWVGCSGNFSIERILNDKGVTLHSNDVSLYSSLLGYYYSGGDLKVTISPEMEAEYGWLSDYMRSTLDTCATLSMCTTALQHDPGENLYYARQWKAYKDQWAQVHERTVRKIEASRVHVDSFYCGDVMKYIDTVPEDALFIAFPPMYKAGYEKLYKVIDKVFRWDAPQYEIFDPAFLDKLVEKMEGKRFRILGTDQIKEFKETPLTAIVQNTPRARPVYCYSNIGRKVNVAPSLSRGKNNIEKLKAGDTISVEGELKVRRISAPLFNELRYQQLNPNIPPGSATYTYAVLYDEKLIGCIAVDRASFQLTAGPIEPMFLLADFAVGGTDYKHLAKLVLHAALSKEFEWEMRKASKLPINSIQTAAFSKHPESMKYRGLFNKHSAKRVDDENLPWLLVYWAPTGQWTLKEGLARWLSQYGDKR